MTLPGVVDGYARVERFDEVGSTNDVVRGWLAEGTPEVCAAVADGQTAGRGRNGRAWTAPPGAALLLSLGFRPTWLDLDDTWRLAAIAALAMADAAEDVAGMAEGSIRLKWPNDLVVVRGGPDALLVGDLTAEEARLRRSGPPDVRKLAGVLGETDGLGTPDPRVVVGLGINADWAAADFPPELATSMSSLREASGGRPIDRERLLDGFLGRLETRLAALRAGRFDVAGWTDRKVTTGHLVTVTGLDGSAVTARALGVDGATGALVTEVLDADGRSTERHVLAGEVGRLRLPSAGVV
ncbi:MAG: biotin--[acetyl-CoA-carboxylase] ligase [Chloroflexi bacterium]|nr:biotin--[acetyl-CoA-carboxylase] ligase [Chloroflexota bacterium]